MFWSAPYLIKRLTTSNSAGSLDTLVKSGIGICLFLLFGSAPAMSRTSAAHRSDARERGVRPDRSLAFTSAVSTKKYQLIQNLLTTPGEFNFGHAVLEKWITVACCVHTQNNMEECSHLPICLSLLLLLLQFNFTKVLHKYLNTVQVSIPLSSSPVTQLSPLSDAGVLSGHEHHLCALSPAG